MKNYQKDSASEGLYSSELIRRLLHRLGNDSESAGFTNPTDFINTIASKAGAKPTLVKRGHVKIKFYKLEDVTRICDFSLKEGRIGKYEAGKIPEMLDEIALEM